MWTHIVKMVKSFVWEMSHAVSGDDTPRTAYFDSQPTSWSTKEGERTSRPEFYLGYESIKAYEKRDFFEDISVIHKRLTERDHLRYVKTKEPAMVPGMLLRNRTEVTNLTKFREEVVASMYLPNGQPTVYLAKLLLPKRGTGSANRIALVAAYHQMQLNGE